MIRNIFPNSFYSIISTPNKEEIFKALKTARVDSLSGLNGIGIVR